MVAVFLPEIINGDESRYVGRFLASQEHLPPNVFLTLSGSSYFNLSLHYTFRLNEVQKGQAGKWTHKIHNQVSLGV